VWQGQVEQVLEALRGRLAELPEGSSDRQSVEKTLGYLEGQKGRMDYASYRQEGLPIMSGVVESTVKQIGRRVKGSEKFWSEEGLEAVLQLRADYLSDDQMVELARASTYYVTATRAEGACLPLRDFLAAGRPGVAPMHTALGDYFGPDMGFTIDSHPEPTCWPTDPSRRLTTTWHRIVWQSLFDQFRASYNAAARQPGHYLRLAESARWSLHRHASMEHVGPLLMAALDGLLAGPRVVPQPAANQGRTAA